jgi:hypothetical protein
VTTAARHRPAAQDGSRVGMRIDVRLSAVVRIVTCAMTLSMV